MNKGFSDFVFAEAPDILALQETKMQPGQADISLPGYMLFMNSAEKKGYSGTAVYTKKQPLSVRCGIGIDTFDTEGRVLTLEYPSFYFVDCYTPNSQDGLKRLDFRLRWEDAFLAYLKALDADKPLILCGDLNVAHEEIDIKNPKSNHFNPGFSDEERTAMTRLLSSGFTDTFRYFYPDTRDAYSWWSYRFHARENNTGWRIDYFIASERLLPKIKDSTILNHVFGSDHCPVALLTEDIWN